MASCGDIGTLPTLGNSLQCACPSFSILALFVNTEPTHAFHSIPMSTAICIHALTSLCGTLTEPQMANFTSHCHKTKNLLSSRVPSSKWQVLESVNFNFIIYFFKSAIHHEFSTTFYISYIMWWRRIVKLLIEKNLSNLQIQVLPSAHITLIYSHVNSLIWSLCRCEQANNFYLID